MLKHIIRLFFFAGGVGVGIWWGANHPSQASQIATLEQAKVQQAVAVANAKKDVLQQVVNEQSADPNAAPGKATPAASHLSKYQQMLNMADQEMNSAKSTQTTP